MPATILLGRAWFIDDPEEIVELEVWEHELEPMTGGRRSGADWCREHLLECNDASALRELLGVPPTGNFQVLFKGTMDGGMTGGALWDGEEWDEWFDLEECKCEPIPEGYRDLLLDMNKARA